MATNIMTATVGTIPATFSKPRRAPRFLLVDTAYFGEARAQGTNRARTNDVSLNGCYLETMNSLPVGTLIRVRLELGGSPFEAIARVVHAQPHMGMGVEFVEIEPRYLLVLQTWLAQAAAQVSA